MYLVKLFQLLRTKLCQFLLIALVGMGLVTLLGTTGSAIIAPVVPLTRVSAPSPFTPGCDGVPQTSASINYLNAEVEPWVAVNPTNLNNIVSAWHQDRWSDGGAHGLVTGVSFDAGKSWNETLARFTVCSGGNATNGGNYPRASDPWVSFAPDGTVHQISISFDVSNNPSSVLVSRSTDGGVNWTDPITLILDQNVNILNDKESITADPGNSDLVYAVWDRLNTNNNQVLGPTYFSRTTDGGQTWEQARPIYDPGINAQTIANQIIILPNGDLLDLFTLITNEDTTGNAFVAVIRSTDKGQTWSSQPTIISTLESVGVTDPQDGKPVRTGDIIPDIALDPKTGNLYVVWQDARFSGGKRDGIVFAKSTDNGLTWSKPVQINKIKKVQGFTGAVDVSADGTIGVTYYDFSGYTQNSKTLDTNYWLAVSYNEGITWNYKKIGKPFDMTTAPIARGYFVGDYEGLAHIDSSFVVSFVRTNSGNTDNPTDVFSTVQFAANISPEESADVSGTAANSVVVNSSPRSMMELVKSHRIGREAGPDK